MERKSSFLGWFMWVTSPIFVNPEPFVSIFHDCYDLMFFFSFTNFKTANKTITICGFGVVQWLRRFFPLTQGARSIQWGMEILNDCRWGMSPGKFWGRKNEVSWS